MGIRVNEELKEFHIFNENISYIFRVEPKINILENVYFGKRITHRNSFVHLVERAFRQSCNIFEGNHTSSLEHIRQEYPCYGTTDYRMPAYTIENKNGSRICEFKYTGYEIIKGKEKLPGLPATYVENEDEAETIKIFLFDEVLKSSLTLSYTIYKDLNIICRNTKIKNEGNEEFYLENLMSASLDLPDADYEMIHTTGAWARECQLRTRKLTEGIQSIYSLRGASSHIHNPYLILKRPNADENQGEVYGFSLVYSGNFLAQVEVDSYEVSRVMLGINPNEFKWKLETGESFQSPESVICYTDKGLNSMSQNFHQLYRTRLARGYWRDKERPILINNWEATYFDFNEEKILNIAKKAQELGIELFVLDDGWFGKRNDDTSSLGDWFANKEKLPDGISGLSEKIEGLGLKFGLWFEPEMVCKGTKIYTEHPDWLIQTPNRNMSHGRNQFVLDFTRDEVIDYIFNLMDNVLKTSKISYIKWDMNRYITEPYSLDLSADREGELFHRYILGVYKLLDKITSAYPDLLIESCAGGGGRFDPGMLYYAPQAWTSDDSDAIERLKIQYGASMIYPISSMGSHVSAVPNHQVGRITPLETRANVAYFGTFGYELNLATLTEEESLKVKDQISFFKKNKGLFSQGDFYRLISPFNDKNNVAWMVVDKNKEHALVGNYQVLGRPNDKFRRLKLKGLDENKLYSVSNKETGYLNNYYGNELMNIGIVIANDNCHSRDFTSYIYEVNALEGVIE